MSTTNGSIMTRAKHDEYDDVRRAFYDFLHLRILHLNGLVVDVSAVEYSLLEQAMDWENRRYLWDWFEIKRKFRNIPARFELSVSVNGELCGLAIGKPSRGRRHVSIYFMEGNPSSAHPLKGHVLPILLEGLALYGEALGCSYIRLIQPVAELIPRYEQAGFSLATDKSHRLYCEKLLKRS